MDLQRILRWHIASDALVTRVVQWVCFGVSVPLLVAVLYVTARLATTPAEVLLGVVAGANLALLFVVMGLVLPQHGKQTTA